ncbi:MAG: hypothetical protein DRO01_04690 [Thermoproteota archaeon]|nr:MAG: hypothetical protein DRO01_04690 [Candidatus Korarchaeota archaeon]
MDRDLAAILALILLLTVVLALAVAVIPHRNRSGLPRSRQVNRSRKPTPPAPPPSSPPPPPHVTSEEMICRLVGETSRGVGVFGADLGVPVIVSTGGGERLALLFGDVFSPGGGGANAAATFEPPLRDCPDLEWVTDPDGRFAEMWPSLREDWVDSSTVPAGAVEVGGVLYVYAMRVTHWAKRLNASDSVHAYGVLFSGRLGEGFVETEVRWPLDEKFVNVAPVMGRLPSGEEVVYLLASGRFRDSPIYLGYVPPDDIADPAAYRYFSGLDSDGAPTWSSSLEDAVPVVEDVRVGELSVIYHPTAGAYLLMYKNYGGRPGFHLRVARDLWGPYSQPEVLTPCVPRPAWFEGPAWGGCYGGYLIPGEFGEDGLSLYYTLSLWVPYSTFLMRLSLSSLPGG